MTSDAAQTGGEATPVVHSFSHVGVTVSDFDRAAAFYTETFGCTVLGAMDVPVERVRALFGVAADAPSCRMGWLRLPGGAILELFAFRPFVAPGPLAWNRGGFSHVALNVDDVDRWHQHLTDRGVVCVSRPERTPLGQRLFYAADPDGNLIELIDAGARAAGAPR